MAVARLVDLDTLRVQIEQIGRTAALVDDQGHGATKVDIDDLRPPALEFSGAGGDQVDVVAVDLGRQQGHAGPGVDLRIREVQEPGDAVGAVEDDPAVDEFDPDQPRAQAGADEAEDPVAHAGHRGQGQDGHARPERLEGVGTDLHQRRLEMR